MRGSSALDEPARLWTALPAVVPLVSLFGGSAVSLASGWGPGIRTTVLVFALATALSGLGLFLRVGAHLTFCRPRYFRLHTAQIPDPRLRRLQRTLNRLVIWNGVTAGLQVALGVWMLRDPIAPIQCVLSLAIVGLGILVGCGTVRTASALKIPRATEVIPDLPVVKTLKRRLSPAQSFGARARLRWPWGRVTPVRTLSAWLVSMLVVPFSAAVADAPASFAWTVHATHAALAPGNTTAPRTPAPPIVGPATATPSLAPTSTGGPSASPAHATYAELCGKVSPGDGAPRVQASVLYELWLGGRGHKGAGGNAAGCAGKAKQVPGQPGVFYAVGRCTSKVRSLGVATANGAGALLYQQAARFGQALAERGELLGSSMRTKVGRGDFYAVSTIRGTAVLIRSQSGAGKVEGESAPGCRQLPGMNVAYTIVIPALAEEWIAMNRSEGWSWPAIDDTETSPSRRVYVFQRQPGGAVVARAVCRAETSCVLRSQTGHVYTAPSGFLTVEDILAYAPPAQKGG